MVVYLYFISYLYTGSYFLQTATNSAMRVKYRIFP